MWVAVLEGLMAAFSRLAASRAGQWVLQILLFFGINFVTSKVAVAPIKSMLSSAFAGIPADVIAWLAYVRVDRALTIILSAYAANAGTRFFMQRKIS